MSNNPERRRKEYHDHKFFLAHPPSQHFALLGIYFAPGGIYEPACLCCSMLKLKYLEIPN